ncbi:hypothetical protein VTI74DRAFT_1644 [Chaetomium olivicolor]
MADCWMAAEDEQRQLKSSPPQPTAEAADVIHAVAQPGTAEIWGAHGCGHSGAWVIVEEAVVDVGGSGASVVVVVVSTAVVVPVGPPPHEVAGLALTHLHTSATAPGTLRALSRPQEPITQLMADCWMAADDEQRQLKSSPPQPTAEAAEVIHAVAQPGTAEI